MSDALKFCIGKPKSVKITQRNIPIAKKWLFGLNWNIIIKTIQNLLVSKMANDRVVQDLLTVIIGRNTLGHFIAKKIVHVIAMELNSVT